MVWGCFALFFFQAEDGIRVLVRSRGLGDVYKRQPLSTLAGLMPPFVIAGGLFAFSAISPGEIAGLAAVSYTHLTLPTTYSV